jgi:hypothetical protein
VIAVSQLSLPETARRRLHIGVSGHRLPPKLPDEAEAPLRLLLHRIFAAISGAGHATEAAHGPRVPENKADSVDKPVVVSSLAEGSDRIVAEAGLAAGFDLEAVLPFHRAEYARDFDTQASRVEFDQLLTRASTVVELEGAANDRPHAYEAAGLFMLAKINLLVAIWDGEMAAGIGGTAEIVGRAVANGIVVLWIEPTRLDALRLSWPDPGNRRLTESKVRPKDTFQSADVTMVARAVKELLAPPTH